MARTDTARSQNRDFPGSLRLGRVAGVPVAVHFSWFLIAALIAFSLAGQFRLTQPAWSPATVWSVAVVTALLFFGTLLLHELSHAIMARSRGLSVRSITLFALGGLAHIEKDATSAKTEFLVAIVGPLMSLAIGFGCLGVARWLGWSIEDGTTGIAAAGIAAAVLGWLGSINILLAGFNLIPGYPLDGGRVLRAILWRAYNDADRATRNAARVGQVIAGLFIAWGVFRFFFGAGLGGLWLAFIGWFLLSAAQASEAEVSLGETLRGVRVGDVMSNECLTVEPGVTLERLVDDTLLRTGGRCVVVRSGDRVIGLITPHEVRGIERRRWPEVTVSDVMRPLDRLRTVDPSTPVSEALETMTRADVNQLPVVSDGQLRGIISRAQVLQLLQSRAEWVGSKAA